MSLSMNYYVVILHAQVPANSEGIGFSFQYEWRVSRFMEAARLYGSCQQAHQPRSHYEHDCG